MHVRSEGGSPDLRRNQRPGLAPASCLRCSAGLILEFISAGSESPTVLSWDGRGGSHLFPASLCAPRLPPSLWNDGGDGDELVSNVSLFLQAIYFASGLPPVFSPYIYCRN